MGLHAWGCMGHVIIDIYQCLVLLIWISEMQLCVKHDLSVILAHQLCQDSSYVDKTRYT